MSYIANAVAVLCGGAVGAVCRFKLNTLIMGSVAATFPIGILCINVLGGFLMGLLQGGMKRSGKPFTVGYSLLGTGFLGGFTTFSTFSLDTFNLYDTGNMGMAGLNIVLNAVLCVCAVWIGYELLAPHQNRTSSAQG